MDTSQLTLPDILLVSGLINLAGGAVNFIPSHCGRHAWSVSIPYTHNPTRKLFRKHIPLLSQTSTT